MLQQKGDHAPQLSVAEAAKRNADDEVDDPTFIQRQTDARLTPSASQTIDTSSSERLRRIRLTTEDYNAMSGFGPLPIHLQNLDFPLLLVDSQQRLIPNENIRHLIEHFMLLTGDEGLQIATDRLQEYLTLALPEPASHQASLLVKQYLEYKSRVHELPKPTVNAADPETTLVQLQESLDARIRLRREIMSDSTADSLFGSEQAYDAYTLVRIETHLDNATSATEKNQKLIEAEQYLPSDMRNRMRSSRERQTFDKTLAKLQLSPSNEHQIYELRKAYFGAETADRITYYEATSEDWQNRVDNFLHEKFSIEQNTELAKEQKQLLIQNLKAENFSKKEQAKLAVQLIREMAQR